MFARLLAGVMSLLIAATASAADPELHVVAVGTGFRAVGSERAAGTSAVTVDRPGKDVVLVVHAYNPTHWEVKATAKTALTLVVATGYHRQTVFAPKDVPVAELTHDAKKAGACLGYLSGACDIEDARFRPMVRSLSASTGLEVASFQGVSQFDPRKPFVVNAVQNDERLSSDFPKLSPRIPRMEFNATRLAFGPGGFDRKPWYGEFTHAGPSAGGLLALSRDVRQVAFDAKAKLYYGIDDHDLYALGPKARGLQKIAAPQGFGWPQALTHDAKRDRLVIATRRELFEYDMKGGKWNPLAKEPFLSYAAVAWQAKTDSLFAFAVERDRDNDRLIPTLFELNANGAIAKRTPLGSPLFPGVLGEHGRGVYAELVDLGAELALLIHSENRDPGTGERGTPEAFLYVIDPKTGNVALAWKE